MFESVGFAGLSNIFIVIFFPSQNFSPQFSFFFSFSFLECILMLRSCVYPARPSSFPFHLPLFDDFGFFFPMIQI